VAEFAERLGFDLADAFARDGEALADFFERVFAAVRRQSEAHLNDLLLAEAATISIGGLLEFKNGYLARPSSKIQTEKIQSSEMHKFFVLGIRQQYSIHRKLTYQLLQDE